MITLLGKPPMAGVGCSRACVSDTYVFSQSAPLLVSGRFFYQRLVEFMARYVRDPPLMVVPSKVRRRPSHSSLPVLCEPRSSPSHSHAIHVPELEIRLLPHLCLHFGPHAQPAHRSTADLTWEVGCWHRHEGFWVRPCGPTQRIGSISESCCWSHPNSSPLTQ